MDVRRVAIRHIVTFPLADSVMQSVQNHVSRTTTTSVHESGGDLRCSKKPRNFRSNAHHWSNESLIMQRRRAQPGDIVVFDLDLEPQDGFVPEHLFDHHGRVALTLHAGHSLPAIHVLLQDRCAGDAVQDVLIDAGWGERRADWVVRVPKDRWSKIRSKAIVLEETPEEVLLDFNPPLAGSTYKCSLRVVEVHPPATDDKDATTFQEATFALGCFWGAELVFMRTPGVVGTQVGHAKFKRKKREAVRVTYDTRQVSYGQLVDIALEWRRVFTSMMTTKSAMSSAYDSSDSVSDMSILFRDSDDDEEDEDEYTNALFYHDAQQADVAGEKLRRLRFPMEILPLESFTRAEDNQQQYLYKGGQSSRKNARDHIKCFG